MLVYSCKEGGDKMEEEIWKPIKDYEGLYEISSLGRVKSLNYHRTGKERMLNPGTDGWGYLHVILCKNGNRRIFKVHRLVANAFLENPDHKSDVNHKDENKINNCLTNLEWVTRKDNLNYGSRNERIARSLSKSVIQYSLDLLLSVGFDLLLSFDMRADSVN